MIYDIPSPLSSQLYFMLHLFSIAFGASSPSSSSAVGDFIVQDFAVIMIVAALMLIITHKLKQPMVIGYIVAGMIIGPYTPPFSLISSIQTVNVLSELGIIMLLFVIGTEFPIAKLKSVSKVSIIVALPESMGTLLIVFFISQTLGFSFLDSMFLALAMSITSTVVTIRILEELDVIKDRSSTIMLGVLIIEDIIAISALAILQSSVAAVTNTVSSTDNNINDFIGEAHVGEIPILKIAISLAVVGAFMGSILILGSRFIPTSLDRIGKTNDYELLLIVILGLAFGLSFAAKLLGLSVVIGAFLAGVLVAESKSAAVVRVLTIPLRDVFSAIFFISIGALMNVSLIPSFIIPAIILILTSFASKFLIITGILVVKSKIDGTTALRTGLGLAASKGEMSLIIAKGGQDVGAISSSVLPILGIITIITTFIAPYIIKFGNKIKVSESTTSQSS
ncbi:MAG TPA: cation:proton antiporter [Nitrososphaeraceae archaeon]|nr:cation:proton antiporter [Nitrososphaeraceae archaeon]